MDLKAVIQKFRSNDNLRLPSIIAPVLEDVCVRTKNVSDFAFQLRSYSVITAEDEEECAKLMLDVTKNRLLYSIIIKKSTTCGSVTVAPKLIQALKDTNNGRIIRILAQSYCNLNGVQYLRSKSTKNANNNNNNSLEISLESESENNANLISSSTATSATTTATTTKHFQTQNKVKSSRRLLQGDASSSSVSISSSWDDRENGDRFLQSYQSLRRRSKSESNNLRSCANTNRKQFGIRLNDETKNITKIVQTETIANDVKNVEIKNIIVPDTSQRKRKQPITSSNPIVAAILLDLELETCQNLNLVNHRSSRGKIALRMPEMMSDISSFSTSVTTTANPTSLPLPPFPIPPPASGSKGRRKSNYSMEFKLQVLTWAKNTSFNAASRQFQVDRKVVKDWVESELEIRKFIEEGQEFRKRLSGAGKKAQDGGLETHLVTWINSHGTEKHLVSRTMIQAEALRYSQNKDFKASKGWLDRFLRRNQNAIGRKIKETSQSQCLPSSTTTSTSADTPSTFTPSFALEQLLTSAASASANSKSQNQTNATELSSKLAPMNELKSLSFGGKATGPGVSLPPPKNICVNCCERLPAIHDSLSRPNNVVREIRTCITPSSNSFGLQINPQIEASRSLTLDQEIIARVKVNHVLASLYKLNFIDQLNAKKAGTSCRRRYRDKNRIRNLQWSLCRRCGTTLTDLYKLYNDFNSFRKADSVLANLINELDDCIHTFSQNVQNNTSNTNTNTSADKNKMAGGGGGEDLEVDRVDPGDRHIFMNQTIFEGDNDDNDDDLEDEMDNSDLYEHGQLPFAMIMTTNPKPTSHSTSLKTYSKKLPPGHSNNSCNLQSDMEESRDSSDTFPSDEQEFKYDPDNDNDNESIDLKVFSPSHGEGEEDLDEEGGGEEALSPSAPNENIEEEEEEEDEGPANQSQAECGQGGGGGSKKRKTSRSLEFKLQVIEWAKTNTTSTTSRKFDVPRKCIQEWKKNESLIRQIVATSDGKKRQRLTGFVEKKDKFKDYKTGDTNS